MRSIASCSFFTSGRMPLPPLFMKIGISASRLAPAENTSSGDQMTRPWYDCSASSTPFSSPSITPGLMRCSLAVMLAISTWPSSVHTRTSSFLKTSVPDFSGATAFEPTTLSRNGWRWYTGRVLGSTKRACAALSEPFEDPGRKRRLRERLAGVDVFLDPLRHLRPAGLLPELERAGAGAEAPAHREVDVARAVGDVGQVDRGVMEAVAQDRPEELRLRVLRVVEQLQALGRWLLQDPGDDLVGLAATGHVVALFSVVAQDVLADLLVKTGSGLLAEGTGIEQLLQDRRRRVAREERVVGQ